MSQLDMEEYMDHISKSAEEWYKLNSMPMELGQDQVNQVQTALEEMFLSPEQNPDLTDRHKSLIKRQVFVGLYRWATVAFNELCPHCEKAGIYMDAEGDELKYFCKDNCGWAGEKHEVLRIKH